MPGDREVRGRRQPTGPTRPRYARITAAGAALLVTLVAVLGGTGVLPVGQVPAQARAHTDGPQAPSTAAGTGGLGSTTTDSTDDTVEKSGGAISLSSGVVRPKPTSVRTAGQDVVPGIPADSGSGRRIVFDMTQQRVWLVGQRAGRDVVRRTYLVSGSVTDNLDPGSYEVYSRSMHAWGVDDSGSMQYMVRFAHGTNAAIGFHDIPVLHGSRVQSRDQLGTPQSHGCIRQWRPDARALWSFAPRGTRVVVVA